ncbi:MAG TPA: cation:proton antiporter, partial [Firmicutes bacterium]|nr:cation:proton antiporter [Bacillota bacterium]
VAFSVMHFWLKQDLVFSLIIASIAATTAPAATIMVMRQFRSDGPVTRTLIPVAALDGVLGVFLFGIAMSFAQNVILGVDSRLWQIVGRAMFEVFGSLVLGALLGLGLTFLARKAGDSDELLLMTIAMILASTGAAKALTLSPLLTNIVMGTVLVNLTQNANRVFFSLNNFTPPIYLLFFTLAGASVNLRVFWGVGLIGLGYILARAAGKLLGAWTGSKVVGAELTVQKYLGVALLPQGGLSVALAVWAYSHLPAVSMAVIAIMVCGALLYEVVGPIMAKTAIQKAGEIRGMTSAIR